MRNAKKNVCDILRLERFCFFRFIYCFGALYSLFSPAFLYGYEYEHSMFCSVVNIYLSV